MNVTRTPITGGCLCGGVRYEVRGAFLRGGHCHCSRCRRHSGAAVLTQGRVRREDFVLLKGADLVRVYSPVGDPGSGAGGGHGSEGGRRPGSGDKGKAKSVAGGSPGSGVAAGAVKAFCSVCGSSLFGGTWPDGSEVSIRLGSVDGDPGIRPQYHTFVGSKAIWDVITDDLPQHDGPLPG